MMSDALYDEITRQISMQTSRLALQSLMTQYTHRNISFDTMMAIYSQRMTEEVKKNHGEHSKNGAIYAERYLAGKSFVEIGQEVKYSPVNIAKAVMLYLHPEVKSGKAHVKLWIKDPQLICAENDLDYSVDPPVLRRTVRAESYYLRMREEVSRAILADTVVSPLIDRTKQFIGVEYELLLREKLFNIGVSFRDETDLKNENKKRTPDALLDVPILVNGKLILWIDSKACFGDRLTHQSNRNQFDAYKSVFGASGLVIYWFGFVESLNSWNATSSAVVMDHFPEPHEIVRYEPSKEVKSLQRPTTS